MLLVLFEIRPVFALVISELMPRPSSGEEWIELYNEQDITIELTGCTVVDQAGNTGIITEEHRVLAPGEFIVLVEDSATAVILNLDQGQRFLVIGRLPGLNDDGDRLSLMDISGYVIDRIAYGRDATRVAGRSWERIDLNRDGEDPDNWGPSAHPDGHTAGRLNSLQPVSHDSGLSIRVEPNPFSPDGDGNDDITWIYFTLPVPQARISIDIFDQRGRQVRRLTANRPAGSNVPVMEWNGRDDKGKILPIGRYIVLLEAIDMAGGRTYKARCTVVLAGRLDR